MESLGDVGGYVFAELGLSNTLLCNIYTGKLRLVIPVSYRWWMFDKVYIYPTLPSVINELLSTRFIWKGLKKQVGAWEKQCIECQSSKIQTRVISPTKPFYVLKSWCQLIHVDIVRLLPPSSGYTYLLTVTDRSTHWPEAIPLNNSTSASCIEDHCVQLDCCSFWGPARHDIWMSSQSSPDKSGEPLLVYLALSFTAPQPTTAIQIG